MSDILRAQEVQGVPPFLHRLEIKRAIGQFIEEGKTDLGYQNKLYRQVLLLNGGRNVVWCRDRKPDQNDLLILWAVTDSHAVG